MSSYGAYIFPFDPLFKSFQSPSEAFLLAHHVELALVADQCREAIGGQGAGRQGVVGVHGCAVLVITMGRDGRIETGPEHPQIDGAWVGIQGRASARSTKPEGKAPLFKGAIKLIQ